MSAFITPPTLCTNCFALDGEWNISEESITPTSSGAISIDYTAEHFYLNVSGEGTLVVTDDN